MILLKDFKKYDDAHIMVNSIYYKYENVYVDDGILIKELPNQNLDVNQEAVLCIDLETKQPYYFYREIQMEGQELKEKLEKINFLEKQVADLSFLVMQLQGGAN